MNFAEKSSQPKFSVNIVQHNATNILTSSATSGTKILDLNAPRHLLSWFFYQLAIWIGGQNDGRPSTILDHFYNVCTTETLRTVLTPYRLLPLSTDLSNFFSLATIFHIHRFIHPSMFPTNTPGTGTRSLSAIFSGLLRLEMIGDSASSLFSLPFPTSFRIFHFFFPSRHLLSPMRNILHVQTFIPSYSSFFQKLIVLLPFFSNYLISYF